MRSILSASPIPVRSESRGRRPVGLLAVGLAALVASAGCSYLPFNKKAKTAGEVRIGGKDSTLTISALQVENLRFSDAYVGTVSRAADVVAKRVGTREASVAALKWKLDQATAAFADATGPNPVWNALDLAVLASVSRMIVEDEKTREEFGDAVEHLVEVQRRLERDAWTLVGQFLTPDQIQELKGLIVEWRKQNPDDREAVGVHFRDFAEGLGVSTATKARPTSIFSMLYIDPLAGLSPTTVAIEQSRELAERVVAYAERAPTLVRWQAELLALQVQEQPAPREVVSDLDRTSRSIESISKTAEGLPVLVDEQRKAAIDQIFAGVAAEREAILAELEAKEATIQTLLGQLRETMNAGGAMGTSLTETIRSLDAFVHYVSPPPDPNAPPAKSGKPFDPLDFGKAAVDVGGMARDLNALLRSANETAPALAKIGQSTGEDLKRVIDHAFWRGLVLILVLLVGYVGARLAYRALARRLEPEPPTSRT